MPVLASDTVVSLEAMTDVEYANEIASLHPDSKYFLRDIVLVIEATLISQFASQAS
jgi:hypothetical protein